MEEGNVMATGRPAEPLCVREGMDAPTLSMEPLRIAAGSTTRGEGKKPSY